VSTRARGDAAMHLGACQLLAGEAGEGPCSVQRFPERDAERELIRRGADRFAQVLLGRHVCRRPDHHAVVGELDVARGRHVRHRIGARDPEVDDARATISTDDDVARLEVAMDDPLAMRSREAAPRLHEHPHDLRPGPRPRAKPAIERAPIDELHRHERVTVVRVDVVDRDHVRMVQPRERLRLAKQPRTCSTARPRTQELESDRAAELRIVGLHHNPHSALPSRSEHHVPPDPGGGRGATRGGRGRHGDPARS
jgi:hypothetical protein